MFDDCCVYKQHDFFPTAVLISVCSAECEEAPCPVLPTPSSDEVQKGSTAANEECLHLTEVKVKPNNTAAVFMYKKS